MTDEKPRVIIIPPKPDLQQTTTVTKQLRVAAYCRVSTKEEEQASSYEAQCEYYTDKIMSNKEWTMAGIFADEGITGTSTKKRTEFLRMIRQCKQKKIDLILTKSIQRFARNTLDCIDFTDMKKTQRANSASFQNRQKSCVKSINDMRVVPACAICKTGWRKIRSKRFSENQNGQRHPSRAS